MALLWQHCNGTDGKVSAHGGESTVWTGLPATLAWPAQEAAAKVEGQESDEVAQRVKERVIGTLGETS